MISRLSACSIPIRALLSHIFPSYCLHCHNPTKESLCLPCAELLTPLSERGRCWRCFQERPCRKCKGSPFARCAAALPHYGPVCSVLKALPYSPHLAKACAGYLAYQLQALKFPTPHLLIPAPNRKKSTARHLTHALSKLLNVPHLKALSPSGREGARLRKRKRLYSKTVLLVTDVVDERCDEWGIALQESSPHRVYGIGLALEEES